VNYLEERTKRKKPETEIKNEKYSANEK